MSLRATAGKRGNPVAKPIKLYAYKHISELDNRIAVPASAGINLDYLLAMTIIYDFVNELSNLYNSELVEESLCCVKTI